MKRQNKLVVFSGIQPMRAISTKHVFFVVRYLNPAVLMYLNFHPLQVVGRDSETQLEDLNKISGARDKSGNKTPQSTVAPY